MAYTTIDDPSVYFQTALYNGSSSSVTVTNDGNSDLKPDWLWFKKRSATGDHNAFDTSRGLTERLFPNLASAVDTGSNGITSLTDGFTSGTFYGDVNANGQTFVTWQWVANGGTTTTNDASATSVGTIDSVYQADTTAGFSIVTYTGTGSAGTIAHGLGSTPQVIITKDRDALENWVMHHHTLGATFIMRMDDTAAKVDAASYNDTLPTSTVFSVSDGGSINQSGNDCVSYCFSEKQGYSKFGSYTANNSTDGPFVYLGFKPAWILVRNTSAAADWPITDNKREAGNPFGEEILFANASSAETNYSGGGIDFLSNGFKIRSSGTNGVHNANNTSHTFIYMAFAESPFVSSEGVPTTAR